MDQSQEMFLAESQDLAVVEHRNGGVTWHVREQRLLAKGVTGLQANDLARTLSVTGITRDHGLAFGQHVVVVARVTLADEVFAGGDLHLLDIHHHLLNVCRRDLLQHGRLQQHAHPVVVGGLVEDRHLVVDFLQPRQHVAESTTVDAYHAHTRFGARRLLARQLVGQREARGVTPRLDPVDDRLVRQQGHGPVQQIDVLWLGIALLKQQLTFRDRVDRRTLDQFAEGVIRQGVQWHQGAQARHFLAGRRF